MTGRGVLGGDDRRAPPHIARVFGAPPPWSGVYSTDTISGRHFGRHSHDTYGFGFLEHGAHGSASGVGYVRAYAGDVITTNPGEVHDGRPLGVSTRRWRILYMDADVMASVTAHHGTPAEITRPVIEDAGLVHALRRLFRRMERWDAHRVVVSTDALAWEESLVESCVRLMARHGTVRVAAELPGDDIRLVRDRLADDPLAPPTLADMAMMTGLSRYQVLRRFERAYGLPPHAWLLRQRAERARALIRNGTSLVVAAAASGFADQSHMSRVFVRQFGFTPGAWQRAMTLQ